MIEKDNLSFDLLNKTGHVRTYSLGRPKLGLVPGISGTHIHPDLRTEQV